MVENKILQLSTNDFIRLVHMLKIAAWGGSECSGAVYKERTLAEFMSFPANKNEFFVRMDSEDARNLVEAALLMESGREPQQELREPAAFFLGLFREMVSLKLKEKELRKRSEMVRLALNHGEGGSGD